ncbi:MAG: hypothetical protein Q8M34_03650 [Thermodesulfovibrionales bacterium]|nr:hypothetical protein [Thermodesulfovibrionales bacterium]
MKVESSKLKVKSCLKKLSTVYCLLSTKKGFTLIEIVLIIVIVSIAIPTLLIMVGQEAKFGVDAELRVTATNVAQQLLEEIKAKCFDETSPVSGGICGQTAAASTSLGPDTVPVNENSVSLYDDVDDFNDLTPASVGAPCTDTVTVNSVTFTREAVACYVNPGNLNTCVDTPPGPGSCNRTGAATNGWVFLRWNNPTANTWNRITVDTSPTIAQNLNSVYMVSSTDGWAVGNNGVILKWNGSNWSKITSITGADLYELYLLGTSAPKGQWREVFQ